MFQKKNHLHILLGSKVTDMNANAIGCKECIYVCDECDSEETSLVLTPSHVTTNISCGNDDDN